MTYNGNSDGLALEGRTVQLLDTGSGIIGRVVLDETETPGLFCEQSQILMMVFWDLASKNLDLRVWGSFIISAL